MDQIRKYLLGGAAAIGLASAAAFFSAPSGTQAANSDTFRHLNLFGDVFELVRKNYVDKVEDKVLIEYAIQGMLSSLDPHSSFLNERAFKDMQESTRGEFTGLGLEVDMQDGFVRVVAPIDETPAARAGVRAGDLITHLDGQTTQGLTLTEAVSRMRGPNNTKITLTIRREGVEKPFDLTITRGVIRQQSVTHRIFQDIGYLRIRSFSEQTADGLEKSIEAIQAELGGAEKVRGYVLDLRSNPGGVLDQSVFVADAFLDRGEIVSTRGQQGEENSRFNARRGDLTKGKPVVVLIDGASASASEIVAGALQDQGRAQIVGTRSFGKGSVQRIIPLQGGTAVKLTISRYYTPSGRSIQAKGIAPDIEVLPKDTSLTVEPEALRPHHLEGEPGQRGANPDSKAPVNYATPAEERRNPDQDVQLQKAFELLRQARAARP